VFSFLQYQHRKRRRGGKEKNQSEGGGGGKGKRGKGGCRDLYFGNHTSSPLVQQGGEKRKGLRKKRKKGF